MLRNHRAMLAGGAGCRVLGVLASDRSARESPRRRPEPRTPPAGLSFGGWATCITRGLHHAGENRIGTPFLHDSAQTGITRGPPRGLLRRPLPLQPGFVSFTSWVPILSRVPDDFLIVPTAHPGPTGPVNVPWCGYPYYDYSY